MSSPADTPSLIEPLGVPLRTRLLLLGWLGPLVLVLDHVTKIVAVETLRGAGRFSYLGDTLRLQYSENSGAFLGLGAGLSPPVRFWIFTIAVGLLLVGIVAFLLGKTAVGTAEAVGLTLIVSGGLSNWIDRVLNQGLVVDFLNLGLGPLRTGIFNVADMAITGGVILLAVLSLGWGGRK